MPKWITVVFVFFLSTTLLTAKAITVEDVISRHMQASINKQQVTTPQGANLLKDYAEQGSVASLAGVEYVDGRSCYKIIIQHRSGLVTNYLVDTKTWYIIRNYIKPQVVQDTGIIRK